MTRSGKDFATRTMTDRDGVRHTVAQVAHEACRASREAQRQNRLDSHIFGGTVEHHEHALVEGAEECHNRFSVFTHTIAVAMPTSIPWITIQRKQKGVITRSMFDFLVKTRLREGKK